MLIEHVSCLFSGPSASLAYSALVEKMCLISTVSFVVAQLEVTGHCIINEIKD